MSHAYSYVHGCRRGAAPASILSTASLLVVLLCAVGCGEDAPSEPALLDSSFHLVLTPTRVSLEPNGDDIEPDFETMRMLVFFSDDDGTTARAVTSSDAAYYVHTTTIEGDAAGPRHLVDTLRSDVEYQPTPTETYFSVDLTELTFTGVDEDGDGFADRLSGEGSGTIEWVIGDIIERLSFDATMTATPDRTPPTVEFDLERESYHPIELPRVRISEMVSADIDAWYEDPTGNRFELPKRGTSDIAYSTFFRPAITPLPPFDSDLSLRFSAPLADLAGNQSDASVEKSIRTAPDPGVFPADGFEGEAQVYLEGDAEVGAGIGTLGAIAGQKSLWIPPDGRAILRMTVPNGATRLRAQARGVYDSTNDYPLFAYFTVIPANGADGFGPDVDEAVHFDLPRVDTGDATWTQASEVVELTYNLPPSSVIGDDVFILIESIDVRGGPTLPRYAGLLIDELVLE